jgi:hypothetical protein
MITSIFNLSLLASIKSTFVALLVCFLLSSCIKSGYTEAVVYNSNFSSGDSSHLKGAFFWKWNNQILIGRYNNGGFELNLSNLPKHSAVEITATPYFHDSWDGSANVGGIDGPDTWQMNVDGENLVYSTFSNSPCNQLYCLQQSYPLFYGYINNPPMTNSIQTLPGVGKCSGIDATSVYKIVKIISHSSENIKISFRDFLVQTNVPDRLCDESWSMSGITVKVINTP